MDGLMTLECILILVALLRAAQIFPRDLACSHCYKNQLLSLSLVCLPMVCPMCFLPSSLPKEVCHLKMDTFSCIDCSSRSPTWSFVPADELSPLVFKELPMCILSVEGTGWQGLPHREHIVQSSCSLDGEKGALHLGVNRPHEDPEVHGHNAKSILNHPPCS